MLHYASRNSGGEPKRITWRDVSVGPTLRGITQPNPCDLSINDDEPPSAIRLVPPNLKGQKCIATLTTFHSPLMRFTIFANAPQKNSAYTLGTKIQL